MTASAPLKGRREAGKDCAVPKPRVVFDGNEGPAGRALFCVSSLYFAQSWLPAVEIGFIDVDNADVSLALSVARWDLGIEIDERDSARSAGPQALEGALVYAGVVFGSASGMRLDDAAVAGVAPVVAIQHPDAEWLSASTLLHQAFAFDPRAFARHVGAVVARLS